VTPGNPDFGFGGSPGFTNAAWDPNGTDYWACKSQDDGTYGNDGTIYKYTGSTDQSTGTPVVTRLKADSPGGSGPFTIKQIGGPETIIAYGPGGNSTDRGTNVYCLFYNTSGTALGYRTGALEYTGGMKTNANATGDVSINASTRKVYILNTNNSISGWNLPGSGVQDWNLY
jgi:hypothetical protein